MGIFAFVFSGRSLGGESTQSAHAQNSVFSARALRNATGNERPDCNKNGVRLAAATEANSIRPLGHPQIIRQSSGFGDTWQSMRALEAIN